jgi:putative ABC transport system permease protein
LRTIRSLLRTPAFTIASIAALALGLGASAALFSVIDGVLLRPLRYPHADRLMTVYTQRAGQPLPLSYPEFVDWRAQARSLDGLAFVYGGILRVHENEETDRALVAMVSDGFFRLMGTMPLLGRVPSAEEERAGSPDRVVVLSQSYWRGHFGSDPHVVGRVLRTDRGLFTVIGVMPTGFEYPVWVGTRTDMWTPLEPLRSTFPQLSQRDWRADSRAIARLAPTSTLERARADLDAVAARLGLEYRVSDSARTAVLTPLATEVVGDIRQPLLMLAAAVGVLLLVACANVATLSLVRGSVREHELAVRAALGAGRWRIARQMLGEGLVLAVAGGAIGLLLAYWTVHVFKAAAPAQVPRLDEIALDGRVAVFTALLVLVTPLLFALVPALHVASPRLAGILAQRSRGGGHGRRAGRLRSALLVGQVALSLALLVGAGLLIRSFLALRAVSPGFDAMHLVELRIAPPARYDTPERLIALFTQLRDAIAAIPGVERAGIVNHLPMTGSGVTAPVTVPGRIVEPGSETQALYRMADTSYFATIGQPVLRGRAFNATDMMPTSHSVIINAALAHALWPGEDPIGKRLVVPKQSPRFADHGQPFEGQVIGVVGNTKFSSLSDSSFSALYLPLPVNPWPGVFLAVRATGDPASIVAPIRRAVQRVDPDIPTQEVTLVRDLVATSLAGRRFNLELVAGFAVAALLLAAVGLYGVVAFLVTQRRHEIGVRSALGASRGSLLRLFVMHGVRLAVLGVVLGIPLGAATAHLLAAMLFGVGAFDAATFATVALLLVGVAALASYLPARRLTAISPVEALREA